MTWTNNFFLILTLTVTASCFLGLWSLGEKKWEKDGWTALASYLLYGVVLLHLVPVAYIIIMRSMVNSDGSMVGIAFEMTGKVEKITGFSGFCWIICILQSPADSDAFQSGRCAKHNGRPETMYF